MGRGRGRGGEQRRGSCFESFETKPKVGGNGVGGARAWGGVEVPARVNK